MTGGIERLNIYYFVSFTFGDTITHVDLVIKTKLPMLIWSLLSNLPIVECLNELVGMQNNLNSNIISSNRSTNNKNKNC
jgi:hypothetical protein